MTYYSDLLVVISELEVLEHGLRPKRSVAELRRLCADLLAVEPAEYLARQLLDMLDTLPAEVPQESVGVFLFDRVRALLGLPPAEDLCKQA